MNTPTPVITCTIYFEDKFLVIRRHDAAKKYGGLWAFPGGKIEVGETIAGTLRREVKEETNLDLEDDAWLLDSYYYGESIGIHFAVKATTNSVSCEPGVEYKWLSSLEELQGLHRIPGIDYHIVQGAKLLGGNEAKISLEAIDYSPDKYIN